MKIERLIGIIFYLINRECVTTNELAQKFEVSRRTILRDIDTLTLAGIPIYSELGVNGGYIINKDFKVDEKIIDNNNKEYILLALNSLRTVYGNKKVIETYEKMKHLYNDVNINTLPDVDFSVVTESPQIMGCVDLINKATKEQRTIKFTYTNSAGNTKKVFLNPLHTYYRWYSWYVFG
ncbi:MAG: HTH domain-containing protein, partial [Bifidobacterium longum]|nr:HTH domain-containing protein [Bifidobacterium longum]